MTPTTIVDTPTLGQESPCPGDLDVSDLWSPAFPSPELVTTAAALFTALPPWDGHEGPRSRLTIAPGLVRISTHNHARHERIHETSLTRSTARTRLSAIETNLAHHITTATSELEALNNLATHQLTDWTTVEHAASDLDALHAWSTAVDNRDDAPGPSRIRDWSRKSRARMVATLAELDYSPLFESGATPAMLTLTYPRRWEVAAPDAKTCKRHIDAFKRAFLRTYGRPLIGPWKREFQRRGAPHYHILITPPAELVPGRIDGQPANIGFREWMAQTWTNIVCKGTNLDAEERHDMLAVHRHARTLDYAEGMRAKDPKRLAVYFSKHGVYEAKDYQNNAPATWDAVGRFWGVWGLEKATATVELHADEALALARVMRRWQRANGFRAQRTVWRTDTRTGAQRQRRSGVWVGSRMRGHKGFIVLNDGPAFASALARYLDQLALPRRTRTDQLPGSDLSNAVMAQRKQLPWAIHIDTVSDERRAELVAESRQLIASQRLQAVHDAQLRLELGDVPLL